jgi:hypothetical protein
MIEIRCFRNADPPRLADVWRAADLGPAAVQCVGMVGFRQND